MQSDPHPAGRPVLRDGAAGGQAGALARAFRRAHGPRGLFFIVGTRHWADSHARGSGPRRVIRRRRRSTLRSRWRRGAL